MNFKIAIVAAMALTNVAAFAAEECEVPPSFIASDSDLTRVAASIKNQHRLDIAVVGTGSSVLPGPDGEKYAYPAPVSYTHLDVYKRQEIGRAHV